MAQPIDIRQVQAMREQQLSQVLNSRASSIASMVFDLYKLRYPVGVPLANMNGAMEELFSEAVAFDAALRTKLEVYVPELHAKLTAANQSIR